MTPGRPRLSPRFFPSPCLLLTFVTFPLTDADLHSFFASLLLCYNIKLGQGMFTSIFMASAATRAAIAGVLLAALWLATWWAVTLP